MLIDEKYFYTGVTRIAQIEGGTESDVKDTVLSYIALYEPKILTESLGYAFYQLLLTNIADARFVSLVTGDTYTNDRGYEEKWNGIKYIIGTDYYSYIANYVYWHYMREQAIQMGSAGTAVTNTENATRINVIQKQVTAWNLMVDNIREMYFYLKAKADIFPEFDLNQCCDIYKQNEHNL